MLQRKSILVSGAEEIFLILLGHLPSERYQIRAADGLAETRQRYLSDGPALLVANLDGSGWQLTSIIAQAAGDGAAVLGVTSTRDHRWIPEAVSRVVRPTHPPAITAAAAALLQDGVFPAAGFVQVPVALDGGDQHQALLIEPDLLWLAGSGRFATIAEADATLTLDGELAGCRAKVSRELSHGGQQGVGLKVDAGPVRERLAALASLQLTDAHRRQLDEADALTERLRELVVQRLETLRRRTHEAGQEPSSNTTEQAAQAALAPAAVMTPAPTSTTMQLEGLDLRLQALEQLLASQPTAGPDQQPAAVAPSSTPKRQTHERLETVQADLRRQLVADEAAVSGMSRWITELADSVEGMQQALGHSDAEHRRALEQQRHALDRLSRELPARVAQERTDDVGAEQIAGLQREHEHVVDAVARLNATVVSLSQQVQSQDERLKILSARLEQTLAVAEDGSPSPLPLFGEHHVRQLQDHQRQLDAQIGVTNTLSTRFKGLKDVLVALQGGFKQLEAQVNQGAVSVQTDKDGASAQQQVPEPGGRMDYGRRGMADALRRLQDES